MDTIKLTIEGDAKQIAALVLELQARQKVSLDGVDKALSEYANRRAETVSKEIANIPRHKKRPPVRR